jgi:hypothetical protein
MREAPGQNSLYLTIAMIFSTISASAAIAAEVATIEEVVVWGD